MNDKFFFWIFFAITIVFLIDVIAGTLYARAQDLNPQLTLSSKVMEMRADKIIEDLMPQETPKRKDEKDLSANWEAPVDEGFDRTKPLYEVYKNGCKVQVDTDLQWYIRDLCIKYNLYEDYVYGMILCESTFNPNAKNGKCFGLCQINIFWITSANMKHFTEDYKSRKLTDPYDNLLTLTEMWTYAADRYDLDLTTEAGMAKVCYWHNTGKNPKDITTCNYFEKIKSYANELISLQ